MYNRQIDLKRLLEQKSFFFMGPRATGKSTLIRTQFEGSALIIDLLKSQLYTRLLADPSELEEMINAEPQFSWVVIDEIQKIPALLDEVHRIIESKAFGDRKIRFLLTGSSARKLKRSGANMLANRAWRAELWPLTTGEITNFKLQKALQYGTLPLVWLSSFPEEELDAYVTNYLKEEIEIECNIRNLPAFARFLKIAAQSSGQLMNYAQVGSDSAVAETTVKSYFQVLQDTLLGFSLEPFTETKKRKAIGTAKFYLFDNGVRNALLHSFALDRNSDSYGTAFESFLANELKAYLSYRRIKQPLCFWRSTSQYEVDFVVGTTAAIEVKATSRVTDRQLRGLFALSEENKIRDFYLVSQDSVARTVNLSSKYKALILPWQEFLKRLWTDQLSFDMYHK